MPIILALAAATALTQAPAEGAKHRVIQLVDARHTHFGDVARQIWAFAEVGYQEVRSSALLQQELRGAGFRVESGVAGMPTAFVATYGQGKPVIAILAEFDALPGLSQDTVPVRKPLAELGSGHGCGHHLFGTASTAAAVAVKEWLAAGGRPGTLRVYGTPAEEGGSGKVYMVRAGLFGDVDVALHWHPSDGNDASPETSLANRSGKFRFRGVSAHAAAAPERGRSALDGVEAMNHMVNLLREHVPQETRMHYVITRGGLAPNVVPDFAEAYHYARHPDARVLEEIWERLVKAAEGAALGTGTTVEYEITGGVYSLLPNETLARLMDTNLRRVGGIRYEPRERAFSEQIRATFTTAGRELGSESVVQPFEPRSSPGSTDVGDVSWVAPTVGLEAATWVPGTAAHSWQAVAAGGTTIGMKGMSVAAKALALTAVDLYQDPTIITRARAEFERRRGPGFQYRPLVGNRPPPLDYRK
jgi:aminobenzoyl-glutamate utilization protein B